MIFGKCPYCDQLVVNLCADRCPVFTKQTCGSCGKDYWLKHSRFDPEAYTVEAFLKIYELDEAKKEIVPKG